MTPPRRLVEETRASLLTKQRPARHRKASRGDGDSLSRYAEAFERLRLVRGWIAVFAGLVGLALLFSRFLDSLL